jgi:t-SNARE complex subunit (syntaxin)
VPESHTSLLLHITEELKEMRANLESLKQDSEDKPEDSKQYVFHALQREIKNLERRVRLLQVCIEFFIFLVFIMIYLFDYFCCVLDGKIENLKQHFKK